MKGPSPLKEEKTQESGARNESEEHSSNNTTPEQERAKK